MRTDGVAEVAAGACMVLPRRCTTRASPHPRLCLPSGLRLVRARAVSRVLRQVVEWAEALYAVAEGFDPVDQAAAPLGVPGLPGPGLEQEWWKGVLNDGLPGAAQDLELEAFDVHLDQADFTKIEAVERAK